MAVAVVFDELRKKLARDAAVADGPTIRKALIGRLGQPLVLHRLPTPCLWCNNPGHSHASQANQALQQFPFVGGLIKGATMMFAVVLV